MFVVLNDDVKEKCDAHARSYIQTKIKYIQILKNQKCVTKNSLNKIKLCKSFGRGETII